MVSYLSSPAPCRNRRLGTDEKRKINMSNYRPICDMWFLARAKLKNGEKYYGSYLGGFVERARVLIGANINSPVLHVCGGKAKLYPYSRAFGPNDKTLDLDPECKPDFLQDARKPFPLALGDYNEKTNTHLWAGVLMDPPYSPEDAEHYKVGKEVYPTPNQLVVNALEVLPIGGKVGIIHYILPRCPKNAKFVACVGIVCGFNNRIRCFSLFERLE